MFYFTFNSIYIRMRKTLFNIEWRRAVLRSMVRERKLTPVERMSSRIGYMGAGLLVAGQWTLNPFLFIFGFICVMIQTTVRKQWNLVLLQLNGLVAWVIHLITNTRIQ